MTQDEAIALFMGSIGKHVDTANEGTVLSSQQLALMLVQGNCDAHVLAFVEAFEGKCECPNGECLNRVIDAVTNCMRLLQKRSAARPLKPPPTQNAQTSRVLQ